MTVHHLARVLAAPIYGVPVWLCDCGEVCRSTDQWDRHILTTQQPTGRTT